MRHKRKENIIIYGSLIAAIVCLIYAGIDYYHDLSTNPKIKDEIKEAFKEMNDKEDKKEIKVIEEEPEELTKIDKKAIIINRLNDIKNRSGEDDLLTYKMLRTWGDYDIINITYQREVADNYYMYIVDIKIPNKEAELPTKINEELSTEEYQVITIKTFIIKNKDKYLFKHFEL